jgi:phosphate starvation-inducible PhoH-like protein
MRKDRARYLNANYVDKLTQTLCFSQSQYSPKGYNQQLYVDTLNKPSNKLLFVVGPAGTGKTMFSCLKAAELLKSGEINKVVVTRPIVSVDEELGFLPGNIAKKMDPWTRPIFDLFMEYYTKAELDSLVNSNVIEISPLAYMRGRTFKNSFIIADEMQNSSPSQMKMLTTRIGTNSRMVITGDLEQTDRTTENGLKDILAKFNNYKRNHEDSLIKIIEMKNTDIERSEIVRKIIDIYKCDSSNNNVRPSWAATTPDEYLTNNKFDFDALYRRANYDFDALYKRNNKP